MRNACTASNNVCQVNRLLTLSNIRKEFGALAALDGIDLEITTGKVVGIIGPNGSGKTTLINAVTGVYPPTAGRITFEGEDITGLKGHQIARRGIARTFQNIRLILTMTAFQNVWTAQHHQVNGVAGLLTSRLRRGTESANKIERVLDQVGLGAQRDVLAKHLPLPARRRLEIARALAAEPKLILLDEPAGGMTPAETADMAALIREVVAPGRTCVVIEHKMDLIAGVCAHLCALDFGCKIAEGTPDQVLANARVQEAYLGQEAVRHA